MVLPHKKDEEWFFENYKNLQKEYGRGWIAVYGQQVVAFGKKVKEAKQLYPNPYISFVEKSGSVMVL